MHSRSDLGYSNTHPQYEEFYLFSNLGIKKRSADSEKYQLVSTGIYDLFER